MHRDVLDEFDRYDRKQTNWLEKLPRCSCCGEPIQDETLCVINDELYCERCIDDCRKFTDDYIN